MGERKSSLNIENLKEIKKQFKTISEQTKKDYSNKKLSDEESSKSTTGNKLLGIIFVIAIIVVVIIALALNVEMLFLPKNSVTIVVSDQNGEVINGLNIQVDSNENSFSVDFDETTGIEVTELGVKPGDYTLTFQNIPKNYTCSKVIDDFTMSDNGKIKLEYECSKDN